MNMEIKIDALTNGMFEWTLLADGRVVDAGWAETAQDANTASSDAREDYIEFGR